jgi:NTE family protein
MNSKQLYILMFLLMALVLIQDRPGWIFHSSEISKSGSRVESTRIYSTSPGELPATKHKVQYKVGVALSGGGVKAFCHAGVLKALEEKGIHPEIISGVSAGAVIAALYADGYSPDSILSIFSKVHFLEYFKFEIPDGGFLSMQGFKEYLDTILHAETFEELSIPIRIVATDLDRGKSVVFESGNLVDAIVASCSVPILFSPYMIDGINYVDGGVLQNLPASVIRDDCKVLIGVSGGPMDTDAYQKSIANVALRSYKFIFRSNASSDKDLCDILIEPKGIGDVNSANVSKIGKIFDLGYDETSELLKQENVKHLLEIK